METPENVPPAEEKPFYRGGCFLTIAGFVAFIIFIIIVGTYGEKYIGNDSRAPPDMIDMVDDAPEGTQTPSAPAQESNSEPVEAETEPETEAETEPEAEDSAKCTRCKTQCEEKLEAKLDREMERKIERGEVGFLEALRSGMKNGAAVVIECKLRCKKQCGN